MILKEHSPAYESAIRMAKRGYRVVTIVPGGKAPRQAEWPKVASIDPDVITGWYTQHPEDGVGLATGMYKWPDGIWRCLIAIDVDCGEKRNTRTGEVEARQGMSSWLDLQDTIGPMPDTVTAQTGGGGWHFLFWLPPGMEVTNDQSGKLGKHVDFRGVGGQILVSPTVHCDTGVEYRWAEGHAPWEIEAAFAPKAFCDYLAAVQKPTRVRIEGSEYSNKRPDAQAGGSAIDHFMAQWSWREVLEGHGWTYLDTRPDPKGVGEYEQWARAGVDHVSATLNIGQKDTLKVFSSSVPQLEAEGTYTKEGFVCAMDYGGDFSKMHAEARRRGFGDETQDRREAFLADLMSRLVERQGPGSSSPDPPAQLARTEESWPEDTRPLYDRYEPPVFPTEALGGWLEHTCRTLAEFMNMPVDIPATIALSVLSLIAMPKCTVQLSSVHVDSVNLYQLLVVRSGGKKTPTWNKLRRPIEFLEARSMERCEALSILATARAKVAKAKEVAALRDVASGKIDEAEATRNLVDAAHALKPSGSAESKPGKWVIADVTPERMAMMMAVNDGWIGLMGDEGGEQIDIFGGRYSDNVSLGALLKGFDQSELSQARVNRPDVIIAKPLCTVMLALQPGILTSIRGNSKWEDRGLTARMLLSVPPEYPTEDDRHHLLATAEVEAVVQDAENDWFDHIVAMWERLNPEISSPDMTPHRLLLRYDVTARMTFAKYESTMMRKTDRGSELESLRPWVKKMTTQVARLAALFFLSDNADGEIDSSYVRRAIQVGDYWLATAIAAFLTGSTERHVEQDVEKLLKWARPQPSFSAGSAFRGILTFQTLPEVNSAISLLKSGGWIRAVGYESDGQPLYEVRPDVDGQLAYHAGRP